MVVDNLEDNHHLNYDDEDSQEDFEQSSFVCEDCDYRWEAAYDNEEWDDKATVCPMCGSINVTQL